MAIATPAARPLPDGRALTQRFAALRRQMLVTALWRGGAWVTSLLVGALVVVGIADTFLQLYPLVRALALVTTLTGAGLLAWRQLFVPLSEPMDDLSLALKVEERHPTLNDALASTVQFLANGTGPDGESASMRHEAVRRTLGRVQGLDFNRIVDSRGLRTATTTAGLFLLLALVLFFVSPGYAATAFWRFTMPFSRAAYPQKTFIELDELPGRVGAERAYQISGTITGYNPGEGQLLLTFEGQPTQPPRSFNIKTDSQGNERFSVVIPAKDVTTHFEFRVKAYDATTEPFSVQVLPVPKLDRFDGKDSPCLALLHPRYTGLPSPQPQQPGTGHVDCVFGTVVAIQAAADRPLKRAWVDFQPTLPEPPGTSLGKTGALAVAMLGVPSPFTRGGLVGTPLGTVEATLENGRKRFSLRFLPAVEGTYTLHLQDENGLVNDEYRYELRVKPDASPDVTLKRPSKDSDQLEVVPTAELPLQITAEDDFAVRELWLQYRVGREGRGPVAQYGQARSLPLYHHRRTLEGALGAHAAAVPGRLKRVVVDGVLAIASLRNDLGQPLQPGDVVAIQARATDFDDVSPFKGPGFKEEVYIHIITPEKAQQLVREKEQKLQEELAELREQQKQAIANAREIEARVEREGKVSPQQEAREAEKKAQEELDAAAREKELAKKAEGDEKQKHEAKAKEHENRAGQLSAEAAELDRQARQLAETIELQQKVRSRINDPDPQRGLLAKVESLRDALRQNNMKNTGAMERADMVRRELDRLSKSVLDPIEPSLARARDESAAQDEDARKKRQERLENEAKAEEDEAKRAEAAARRLDEKAEREEMKAGKAGSAAEKERHEKAAAQARKEAKAEQERAAEKKAQAEKKRREAARPFDKSRVTNALSEAREGQQEVERALDGLLKEIEPAGTTRQMKSELARLQKEQEEAKAQLEEVEKKTQGKDPSELTPKEQEELKAALEAQKKVEEKTRRALKKMGALAKSLREKDPETARDIDKAREEAEKNDVAGKMEKAAAKIRENKLNEAKQHQQEAKAELDKLAKNVENKRDAELNRLIKKTRDAEKKVEELVKKQELLRQKMRDAARKKDKKELARLAREQEALKKEAEEVVKQLSRLRNERAREALGAAGAEMDAAGKKLERGERNDGEQEDVLDRLEEARKALAQERKKAEDQLTREQLGRIADLLKRLRERWEGHLAESKRIQDAVQSQKKWDWGRVASLRKLGENEKGLSEEALSATKQMAGSPVYIQLMKQIARDMEKSGERAQALAKEAPPTAKLPDEELARHQQAALRKLNQLLESLKEEQEKAGGGQPAGAGGGGGGGEDGDGGPRGDGLPPTGQLKLLRAMQVEVNKKTAEFRKQHPDLQGLTDKEKQELDDIRREQKEVADLLEKMAQPPGEPDEDDNKDEKKEEKKDEKKEKKEEK